MAELKTLINIGQELQKKLNSVDIHTTQELMDIGAKQAFLKLKSMYPETCLIHLYALHGAVENVELSQISNQTRHDLKSFNERLKANGVIA